MLPVFLELLLSMFSCISMTNLTYSPINMLMLEKKIDPHDEQDKNGRQAAWSRFLAFMSEAHE